MTQTTKAAMVSIRNLVAGDISWLVELNNDAVPAVSPLSRESGTELVARAAAARLAQQDGQPLGALIGFVAGSGYDSTNYRWFEENEKDFLYIDRVMVSETARNRGIGLALYEDAARLARRLGLSKLACEVNEDPPNPGSMRFHERLGFRRLVSRVNEGDGKRVAMLVMDL